MTQLVSKTVAPRCHGLPHSSSRTSPPRCWRCALDPGPVRSAVSGSEAVRRGGV